MAAWVIVATHGGLFDKSRSARHLTRVLPSVGVFTPELARTSFADHVHACRRWSKLENSPATLRARCCTRTWKSKSVARFLGTFVHSSIDCEGDFYSIPRKYFRIGRILGITTIHSLIHYYHSDLKFFNSIMYEQWK